MLDFLKASHGNASGLGNADFTTKKVFDHIDFVSTYAKMITSGCPEGGKIPIVTDIARETILVNSTAHLPAAF